MDTHTPLSSLCTPSYDKCSVSVLESFFSVNTTYEDVQHTICEYHVRLHIWSLDSVGRKDRRVLDRNTFNEHLDALPTERHWMRDVGDGVGV